MRRIVGQQLARAEALLVGHRDALERLATRLLELESLDGSAVKEALSTPARSSEMRSARLDSGAHEHA